MNLNDVKFGHKYMDRKLGAVLICGAHPYDGACLIAEVCNDPDELLRFEATEACYLAYELPDEGTPDVQS